MSATLTKKQLTIPVATDKQLQAYMACPIAAKPRGAVIVGMELFGLTPYILNVTDRLADQGYLAIAPDFYHHLQPGVVLGYDQQGRSKGFELLAQLNRENVVDDVRATMHFLREHQDCNGKIGFLGLSVGGHIGYLCASQLDIAASVIFYAGWLTNTDIPLSQPQPTLTLTPGIARQGGTLLYLIGDQDHLVNDTQRREVSHALQQANVHHEMVIYPGAQHGFFCDDRATFDQAASADAWHRTTELFAATLIK